MRKKGTLQEVNKYNKAKFNRPLFLSDEENLFNLGGVQTSGLINNSSGYNFSGYTDQFNVGQGLDYNAGMAVSQNIGSSSGNSGSFGGGSTGSGGGSFGITLAKAAPGIMAGFEAGFQDKPQYTKDAHNGFSMVDTTLTGGKKSKLGTSLVNSGASWMNQALSSGDFKSALWAGIAGTVGTIINNGWGYKVNEERLKALEEGIKANRNYKSEAVNFDDVRGPQAVKTNSNIYEGGVFTSDDAAEKNEELREKAKEALLYAQNNMRNNVNNIADDQLIDYYRNFSAFGGPIETRKKHNMKDNLFYNGGPMYQYGMLPVNNDMDLLTYDLLRDKQALDYQKNQNKNQMTNMFMGTPSTMFAIGGDMQANGADFSSGLTHIDAGSSHEMNPNDGVQMGVDNEGTPNLVEEGETVFNDYVYSTRILADEETKKKFHLPKKKDITYAEISKKLEKEIAERPNDPISQAGFKAQMETLANEQERQKQEMEAERAKAAFEALSPEEQTAIMQRAAQKEQMAQQAAQEQAMAQQQAAMQQPSPEEAAMMQQQMLQADGSQAALGQQAPIMAYGGKINKFDKGGIIEFLNKFGYKTVADAEKAGWKPSDFGNYTDWKDINSSTKLADDFKWTDEFSKRLTSPEQRAALSLGWNPLAELVGRRWYEGDNGNDVGWTQSFGKDRLNAEEFKDYAKRYKNTLGWAVENGLIKAPEGNSTISTADVAKAMSQAPDWKATDDWLYSDIANQEKYIGMARGMNPDDDTKFINKWSRFGDFTKGEDGWTYKLKDNLSDADRKAFTDQFRRGRTDNRIGVMYNSFQDPSTATNRYLLDENGNPVLITGDDLSGYDQLGEYTWGNPDNNTNNTAIFYRAKDKAAPEVVATPSPQTSPEEGRDVDPDKRPSWLRYAGLFGPAVGLGMQALGIGRPDTSGIDAAIKAGNGPVALAEWMPRGDFARYQPNDPWFYTSPIMAQSNATQRAINNKVSPSKGAETLANSYNTMVALGNAQRQQLDSNFDRYMKVKDFNGNIFESNAQRFDRNSQFNADARNRNKQYAAQLAMQGATQKMDADAGWYNGLYGNVAGLFKGIGDIGLENERHNMVSRMAANGIFGNATPDTPVFEDFIKWQKEQNKEQAKKSKGGKNHKKHDIIL